MNVLLMLRILFVADRNVFADAYLAPNSENGYKAKSHFYPPYVVETPTSETTTYGGYFML